VKTFSGFVVFGDTAQKIVPDGISRLKSYLQLSDVVSNQSRAVSANYFPSGTPIPAFSAVDVNYRSTATILALSQVLIDLQHKRFSHEGDASNFFPQSKSLSLGETPRFIYASSADDCLGRVFGDCTSFIAGQIVLVRNDESRDELLILMERLRYSAPVYTIEEWKGREADSIVLYDFFRTSKNEGWFTLDLSEGSGKVTVHAVLKNQKGFESNKHREWNAELKLLYVAITR